MDLRSHRDLIFWTGVALLIAGGTVFFFAHKDFGELPNYARLAAGIPLTAAWPMLRIDEYINWGKTTSYDRGYLYVAPFVPFALALGSLAWLFLAPEARA